MLKCNFCNREFPTTKSRATHYKHCKENPKNNREYPCKFCGEILDSESSRLVHMNQTHKEPYRLSKNEAVKGGIRSGVARLLKCTAYPELRNKYKIHWKRWLKMKQRAQEKGLEVSPELLCCKEGFKNFVDYIGPIPENMVKPTIGRINHSKGYLIGNFRWQSYRDNCKDKTGVTINFSWHKSTEGRTFMSEISRKNKGNGNLWRNRKPLLKPTK